MITRAIFTVLIVASLSLGAAYGAEQTELFPIAGNLALERTVLNFEASPDNELPWAYVEGQVSNHAAGYPVIIQIYSETEPVHFAQAPVSEDGSYEYKFRVKSVHDGETIRIFDGAYSVIVSKVVQLSTGVYV